MVKMAIFRFPMLSCGSPARACWAELEYDRIIAVGGRGFELWLLKVQKNGISSILSLTGMSSLDDTELINSQYQGEDNSTWMFMIICE